MLERLLIPAREMSGEGTKFVRGKFVYMAGERNGSIDATTLRMMSDV